MKHVFLTTLTAAAVAFTSMSAHAQSRRRAAPGPDASRATAGAPSPSYSSRGPSTYSAPPGYRGTIRSDTPNADGNFGGPGSGGGNIGG